MRYKVSGAIAIPKASWGCAPALPNRIRVVFLGELLLGKTVFRIRQKGVPPLLLPASVLQLPRCLARIYNLDFHDATLFELDSFKRCNCSRKSNSQKSNLLRKCGLLAHTSPTFLKNCWIKKLFSCLWLVPYNPSRKNLPRTIPQTAISFNTATKPHFPQFPVFLRLTNFRKSPIIKSVPIEQLYARRFGNAAHFIR